MLKKFIKILVWIAGLFLLLAVFTLTTVDWSDYQKEDYYKQTMEAIEDLQYKAGTHDFLLAGWATVNATPSEPQNLVGYRPRGPYKFVQDSSYVKSLVLQNGQQTVAFLNYELLIVHPFLAKSVEDKIRAENLPIDKVYFTATHTHSGMGGYIPGLMGRIAFGGYDEATVNMLEESTVMSLRSAMATMDTVQVQYKKTAAKAFVMNRFIAEDPVDPYLRQLLFTKSSGESGTFLTYSAHATCLNSKFMGLSGDYPQYLVDYIEEDNTDFALFAAGTVGSHRPVTQGNTMPAVKRYAHALDSVLSNSPSDPMAINRPSMKFTSFPLLLREPHYRISDNIRFRPWVFNLIFGETNAHFDVVQLGNTLMISSSGEISGVFYDKWEKMAAKKGMNLVITTFNGGYIGYITPDKYYNYHYHEVRDMNLFGPYNGAYFDEIITGIIETIGENN